MGGGCQRWGLSLGLSPKDRLAAARVHPAFGIGCRSGRSKLIVPMPRKLAPGAGRGHAWMGRAYSSADSNIAANRSMVVARWTSSAIRWLALLSELMRMPRWSTTATKPWISAARSLAVA